MLVELRDENGEVLARAGEIDGAVPGYLPDFENDLFPTIRYIDRYGNTVFNALQMQSVIPELEKLRERATTEAQRRVVDGVLDLARMCSEEPHLYLVFVGD